MRDPASASGQTTVLVVFRIAETVCALGGDAVTRVLPMPRLAVPPGLPLPLAGFLDLAGQPIAVVALDRLFDFDLRPRTPESEAARHVLLVRSGAPRGADAAPLLGWAVDRVLDVVAVPNDELSPVDDATSLGGCVRAEWAGPDGVVHLLDADRLLGREEQARLDHLVRAQGERLSRWADQPDAVP